MVFVDIGANQGEFSLFAAKRLTKGKVLAFEPMNFFYDLLNENIGLNQFKNIETFHYGLSDVSKELPIYLGKEGEGEHEGLGTIFPSQDRNRFVQNIDLKVFDDVVKTFNLSRIDFMKIDVEGAEMLVLNGSREAIKKFRPSVMIEINDATYRAAGYSVEDVKLFFKQLNYSLCIISKGGVLKKSDVTPEFCNAVFVPND
jgi:FkbM family methyltransferase